MVYGAGGQNTLATSGISNMERNTETPSTIEDLILLSRFCQSWTNQRLMASTRSLVSLPGPACQTISWVMLSSSSFALSGRVWTA